MIDCKRIAIGVLTLSVLGVFAPSPVLAQHGPGRHMPKRQATPVYDPNNEVTINGIVANVSTGDGQTQLLLKTDSGNVRIELGPTVFVTERKAEIQTGDRLQVTGSRVTIGETQIILAREMRRGDETWILRGAAGEALWSPDQAKARGFWTKKTVLITILVAKVAGLAVMLSR